MVFVSYPDPHPFIFKCKKHSQFSSSAVQKQAYTTPALGSTPKSEFTEKKKIQLSSVLVTLTYSPKWQLSPPVSQVLL